ncbi:MAG: hypothetical protein ACXVHQ_39530 [Solirubrobacteraceae bacterium]
MQQRRADHAACWLTPGAVISAWRPLCTAGGNAVDGVHTIAIVASTSAGLAVAGPSSIAGSARERVGGGPWQRLYAGGLWKGQVWDQSALARLGCQ